jgi:hypothetical protein
MYVGHWFSFASKSVIADLALPVRAPLKMSALDQCSANLIDCLASWDVKRLRNFVIVTARGPAYEIQHAFPMPHGWRLGGDVGEFKPIPRGAKPVRLLLKLPSRLERGKLSRI